MAVSNAVYGKNAQFHYTFNGMKRLYLVVVVLASAAVAAGAQAGGGGTVTLAQVVDLALQEGPDIRQASLTLEAARSSFAQTRASKEGVSLAGSGGASHTGYPLYTYASTPSNPQPTGSDSANASLSFTAPTTSVDLSASYKLTEGDTLGHSSTFSLSAKQDIWDGMWGGRDKAAADQARLTLQVKELDFQSARRSVAYKAKQAYYTLLGAQRTLEIKEETLEQRQEESRRTQALYEADKASGIDVKQAEINLASARIDLRSASSALRSARAKLSTLMGWPSGREYTVADVEEPPVPSLTGEAALQTALAGRIDLMQIVLNRRSGEISLALKRADSSPVLNATGNASYSRDWVSEKDSLNWSAGLTFSVPIYDSGLLDAQRKAVDVQNGLLAAQEEALRQSIASSVQDDMENVDNLTDLADLAAQNLELSRAQYELAQAKFEAGTVSNLDLLSASVNLTTAKANLAKAKNNVQLGILQLANTLGQ